VLNRGHLRGRGGAQAGETVALAATLTLKTCLFNTLVPAYEVALCACTQGRNAADAKTGNDAAGAAGGFGRVWGRLQGAGGGE
jgi:hypothetical protein